jgi:hypothetical protein
LSNRSELPGKSLRPIGYNRRMNLQFSLATLMVCVTLLAAVCAFSVAIPVKETQVLYHPSPDGGIVSGPVWTSRSPNGSEIACRMVLFAPATLVALWLVRTLRSGRMSTLTRD